MKKKTYKLLIILAIAGLGLYLYLSHAYIYYRIGKTALPASDRTYSYIMDSNDPAAGKITYAALGDSLTAGVGTKSYEESYPYRVAHSLQASGQALTLEDFSYPGAKTADLIRDLLTPAIIKHPDMVTVLIGVNDIHGGVNAEEFKDNYEQILKRLRQETSAKIYVISIPLIGSDTLLLPPYYGYFSKKTSEYNRIIKELADRYQAQYIDITSPTLSIFKKNGPHYAADSFHPSASGYALWSKIIYDNIHP